MSRYALAPVLIAVLLPGVAGAGADSVPQDWPLVVAAGALFVSGERVDPPYVFAPDADTLRVNQVPILPLRRPDRQPTRLTEADRARCDLIRDCFAVCGHLVQQGFCHRTVRDSARTILLASPAVDEALVHDETSLRVRWADGPPWEEYMNIEVENPAPPRSWPDLCTASARHYGDILGNGNIVIVGASGEMILQGGRMAALESELTHLLSVGDPESGELKILSSEFAREFLNARTRRHRSED
jgi:hypothetical protein